MKIKLKFAIFALFVATLLCSCGGPKVQLPALIELKTPEKPLDAKYFKYSLNKAGHVNISEIDWAAVVNDDVFENILIPATIEGIPVDSVKIKLFGSSSEAVNKAVQKKQLKMDYESDSFNNFSCQRIEFEEGIKEIELNSQSECYVSYDKIYEPSGGKKRKTHEETTCRGCIGEKYFNYTSSGVNLNNDSYKSEYTAENVKLKTFGLREIVFHKGQKKITGDFGTCALERLVLPEDLENIEFKITTRGGFETYDSSRSHTTRLYYVNCPLTEIVWPKSDFKITSSAFRGLDFTKMNTLVLPDSLKEIRCNDTAFPWMKVKKIVLPKKLNFTIADTGHGADGCEIDEIEIPADAVITNRRTAHSVTFNKSWVEWQGVMLPRGLKKITLGENSTSDPFLYPSSLEEMDIADSAKINFAWQLPLARAQGYSNPENLFTGCKNLPLATQVKLNKMGYKGKF